MRQAPKFNWLQSGFTLVEISIVLAIIALVSVMGMTMGSSMIESAKIASTNTKLDTIEAALMAYRVSYGRLPCPTDPAITASGDPTHFGYEAANTGTCTGGSPAAPFSYTNKGNTTVEGAVPFKTLGLTEEFMFDGWGRKIGYAVWTGITGIRAFTTYGAISNCGTITVKNAGGNTRSTASDYVLISYGPDGHGGYLASGSRYNAGSTNTDEQTDAHYSNLGVDTGYAATYVQKDWTQNAASSTDTFDDLVRYKERWQLMTTADQWSPNGTSSTCGGIGFRVDGPAGASGMSVSQFGNSGPPIPTIDINNDGYNELILDIAGNPMVGDVLFGRASWPAVIDLNTYTLDGTSSAGFGISFDAGFCGSAFAGGPFFVADFDGDGHPDLFMADNNCVHGVGRGVVVFGGQGSYDRLYKVMDAYHTVNASIDGTKASLIYTDTGNEGGYTSFAAAGHFTTDTAAGLLFNESCSGSCGGRYIRSPGARSSWTAVELTSTMNTTDFTGLSTYQTLADVNNDGHDDIITYDGYNPVGIIYGGAGPSGSWGSSYSISNVNTASNPAGLSIAFPAGGSAFGGTIAVGDLSGDHINDLIIGEPGAYSTFALYGPLGTTSSTYSAGWNPSTVLNGTTGSTLTYGNGVYMIDNFLFGDLNNDGKQDLIGWDNQVSWGTYVVILFGGGGYGSSYNTWGDSKSVIITGDTPTAVVVGDINGDGYNDLINAASGSNKVYVIWGKATWPGTIDLSSLSANQGTVITGTLGGSFGASVSAVDINGDHVSDLIMCAPGQNNNGQNSGSCYVLYGHTGTWMSAINDTDI